MTEITKSTVKMNGAKTEEDFIKQCPFPAIFVRGLLFPKHVWYSEKNLEESLDMKPRDTDIIVISSPKSGTNWLMYIIYSIITQGKMPFNHIMQLFRGRAAHAESCGTQFLEAMPDPRLYFFHLPYYLCPKNPKTKYLYIVRNPKDVIVSVYKFSNQFFDPNISLDVLIQAFVGGVLPYGNYFDHVLSWYEHRHDQNVLFISYEQLETETEKQVLRIARFLGENYRESLENDKSVLDKVLKLTSFENMKKTMPFDVPLSQPKVENCEFFRKGISGDWKNYFSDEQARLLDKYIEKKFGGTDIISMITKRNGLKLKL